MLFLLTFELKIFWFLLLSFLSGLFFLKNSFFKKKIFYVTVLLFIFINSKAQIISTIAGSGPYGLNAGGA